MNFVLKRDAPPEYSTVPFNLEPEILPDGAPVPVNNIGKPLSNINISKPFQAFSSLFRTFFKQFLWKYLLNPSYTPFSLLNVRTIQGLYMYV